MLVRKTRATLIATCGAGVLVAGALTVSRGDPDRPVSLAQAAKPTQQEIGTTTRPAPRLRPKGERWVARWAFRPDDVSALTAETDAAFAATVTRVRPGPSLGGESVHHKPGEYELPTEIVTLSVEEPWYGVDEGATVEIRKVGTPRSYVEGDPRYEVGERYAMFVEKTDRGEWGLVAPDGRFRIVEGRLQPVIDGAIGRRVKDKPTADLKREAQNAKKEQTP